MAVTTLLRTATVITQELISPTTGNYSAKGHCSKGTKRVQILLQAIGCVSVCGWSVLAQMNERQSVVEMRSQEAKLACLHA